MGSDGRLTIASAQSGERGAVMRIEPQPFAGAVHLVLIQAIKALDLGRCPAGKQVTEASRQFGSEMPRSSGHPQQQPKSSGAPKVSPCRGEVDSGAAGEALYQNCDFGIIRSRKQHSLTQPARVIERVNQAERQ